MTAKMLRRIPFHVRSPFCLIELNLFFTPPQIPPYVNWHTIAKKNFLIINVNLYILWVKLACPEGRRTNNRAVDIVL